jgi:hypothetical protein
MLALFAAKLTPSARPPTPALIESLQELVQARDSAIAKQTALKNQRAVAESVFLCRQLAQRKAPKSALIAVARKLLVLANALRSQNRLWQTAPPNHA